MWQAYWHYITFVNLEHRLQKDFAIITSNEPVSSRHLQQQELVAFLYSRSSHGILITLLISAIASMLAYIELTIQNREFWVIIWFILQCFISLARWHLLRRFQTLQNKAFFNYQKWHNRFYIGVAASGTMLGVGAALLLPYVTTAVQIILHSMLLCMSAGAIAYLSTSLRIYISYLVVMMMPVTLWLFVQQRTETYVLSFLFLFFMAAGWISVKRMNVLVNDALYYRFDNETLIEDLQRLLTSVSQTNKALEKISITDELTGISNYRAFRVRLEEVWQELRGSSLPLSVLRINPDYYREFNAFYGQEAADRNLREIAQLLNEQLNQPQQMAARLEGADFVLLLPEVDRDTARRIGEQLLERVNQRQIEHLKSRSADQLTLSIGLGSQTVRPGSNSRELLVRVDIALKLAQERGGNRLEIVEA